MPSINNILGPFLLGLVFSSILYGVICLQVYSYFTHHSVKDRKFLKFFVIMLLIFDTLQMAFLIHGYYLVGVTNFGNFIADLMESPWCVSNFVRLAIDFELEGYDRSLRVQITFGFIVAVAIQQFYAWRIYKLSMGKIYIPVLIVTITLSELAIGLVYVVQSFQYPDYLEASISTPIMTSGLSLEVACDIIITASMVYYLIPRGSKVKRSNISPTTILAVYCINSGFLSLIFATLCLATSVAFPSSLIYAPFWFILVRLYSCSFMAILNSRDHLRAAFHSDSESDPGFATFSVSVTMPNPRPSAKTTSGV
ncbi:hypothetical protein BGW80DRAFT_1261127 [Lactifluus volemus]|nr:hypothetical protein BGW80DRAFT_1261127 [Lactifluus volemus]